MRAAAEETGQQGSRLKDVLPAGMKAESRKPEDRKADKSSGKSAWPENLWQIQSFQYEEVPAAEGARFHFAEEDSGEEPAEDNGEFDVEASEAQNESERARMEEAARAGAIAAQERERAFAEGREAGLEEGRAAERRARAEEAERTEELRRAERAEMAEAFDCARGEFLREAEPAVAKLALAVAARILRREAQMDPLLLTGAVRVALGQISNSTRVRLKVPEADLSLWKEAIALVPKLSVRPEIVPGAEMRVGECVIETELGSADLGVRAQLQEIERGFFDRPSDAQSFETHTENTGRASDRNGATA